MSGPGRSGGGPGRNQPSRSFLGRRSGCWTASRPDARPPGDGRIRARWPRPGRSRRPSGNRLSPGGARRGVGILLGSTAALAQAASAAPGCERGFLEAVGHPCGDRGVTCRGPAAAGRAGPRGAIPAHDFQDPVEPGPLDALHRVVAEAADLADVKDRDDMRVMQRGGRLGLVQEPLASPRLPGCKARASRTFRATGSVEVDVDGLVDDAHAPAPSSRTIR